MKGITKMVVIFKILQKSLHKLIDLLMTVWLWANKNEKAAKERKRDGS